MRLLISLLLLVPSVGLCDDFSGLQTLLSDKLKEAKPVGMVSIGGKPGGAAFLPVYTLHSVYDVDKDGKQIRDTMKDYIEIGAGYRGQEGQKPCGFAAFDINLVGLSRRLLSGDWAQKHIERSPFPPIFVGPSLQIPFDLPRVKTWTIKENIGMMASVRFK